MTQEEIRTSERFHIACILAIVGGFLDIYTYTLKGSVFATAETGNLILLGIGSSYDITNGKFLDLKLLLSLKEIQVISLFN